MNNYDETESELVNRLRVDGLPDDKPDISDLMYQCGFAAGQQQARSKQNIPSIRMLAAAAVLVLLGIVVGRWDTSGSTQTERVSIAKRNPSNDMHWMRIDQSSHRTNEPSRPSTLIALQSKLLMPLEDSYLTSGSIVTNSGNEEVLTASGFIRQINRQDMN